MSVQCSAVSGRSASPAALWSELCSCHAFRFAAAASLHHDVAVLAPGAISTGQLHLPLTCFGLLATLTLMHHHVSCCRIPVCTHTNREHPLTEQQLIQQLNMEGSALSKTVALFYERFCWHPGQRSVFTSSVYDVLTLCLMLIRVLWWLVFVTVYYKLILQKVTKFAKSGQDSNQYWIIKRQNNLSQQLTS